MGSENSMRRGWQYYSQLLLCVLILSQVELAQSAEFSGYGVLTSDYVYRGVTQSDGDVAAQLGLDLGFDSGFYAGLWASTTDISGGPGHQRDFQANYYLGYERDLSARLRLNLSGILYTYPDAEGDIDYDFVEYLVGLNFDDRLWLEYAYSPDLFNTGADTHNIELYGEWLIAGNWIAGLGIGHYDVSSLSGRSYSYWSAGVSRTLGPIDIDLRYHDTSDWAPFVSSQDRAGERFALTLTFPF